jgi:hypothetical protein
MKKPQRPTHFIQHDIARGRQDVNAIYIFERGPAKVRTMIRSDSCDFQSYARIEILSTSELKWNVVGHIPFTEMQTPHKLYYRTGPIPAETFNADFDKLLSIVDGLLGLASTPAPSPAVVLVFADAPEGTSVEDALIGPKFFKDERAAMQRFAEYFVPRIRDNEALSKALATCLDLDQEDDFSEIIVKIPEAELIKMVVAGQQDHLRTLCDEYVSHQMIIGGQAFYRIETVPESIS